MKDRPTVQLEDWHTESGELTVSAVGVSNHIGFRRAEAWMRRNVSVDMEPVDSTPIREETVIERAKNPITKQFYRFKEVR